MIWGERSQVPCQVSLADDVHVGGPESAQRLLGIDPVLRGEEALVLAESCLAEAVARAMPLR